MNLCVRNIRRGHCEVLANEQSGQRYHTFAVVTKDADGLWRWRSGDDDIEFLAQMAHYSDGFRTRGECVADCEKWAYRQMVDEAVRRQPTPSVQLNCARNRAVCELSSTSLFTAEEMRHLRKMLASYHDDEMDGCIGGLR